MSETILAGAGLSLEQFYLKCTLAQEGAEAQRKGVCVFLERDICRSPMAQGVFEEVVRREGLEGIVEADSAGTHSYHLGEAPDERAQKSMACRGIDIGSQRARKLTSEDCREFDYILFMDEPNRRLVEPLCRNGAAEVRLFLDYAPELPEREIPDPYYGGPAGFDRVIKLVEAASEGLLEDIKMEHLAGRI